METKQLECQKVKKEKQEEKRQLNQINKKAAKAAFLTKPYPAINGFE
ncbi:hypothetical protein SNR37_002288 [Agarivorans aestuarii]|uniref:Uncharacterized protein n=1 Tax=Agarivorans aestuarii TaxID=1563703 RepID=A0ABU7G0C8_9ALTE|nr:hypothetical protein [Agarivorans aestuarii]MEE1672877.1 hypothetical protein [Agarivorans aestuarii]